MPSKPSNHFMFGIKWCPNFDGRCLLGAYISIFWNQGHPIPIWKCVHVNENVVIVNKSILPSSRVEQPMNDHLSVQGRPNPRGRFCCFWCPNKTWTPPIDAFSALKIIKNILELRKLWPPKIIGVKNSKEKQTTRH